MDPITSFRPQNQSMAADATRVHVNMPLAQEKHAPASTQLPFVNANLHETWKNVAAPSPAPADATRVASHPRAEKVVPRPREQYIQQATTRMDEAEPIPDENLGQENINHTAELDPFAAGVNGYHDMSLGGKPDWQRIGPSPLEVSASLAQPTLFGAYYAQKSVREAVHEPTALNIGLAALGTGSLLLGSAGHLPNLPSGMHAAVEGAEKVHGAMNAFELGGGVENLKETLHGGEGE